MIALHDLSAWGLVFEQVIIAFVLETTAAQYGFAALIVLSCLYAHFYKPADHKAEYAIECVMTILGGILMYQFTPFPAQPLCAVTIAALAVVHTKADLIFGAAISTVRLTVDLIVKPFM